MTPYRAIQEDESGSLLVRKASTSAGSIKLVEQLYREHQTVDHHHLPTSPAYKAKWFHLCTLVSMTFVLLWSSSGLGVKMTIVDQLLSR